VASFATDSTFVTYVPGERRLEWSRVSEPLTDAAPEEAEEVPRAKIAGKKGAKGQTQLQVSRKAKPAAAAPAADADDRPSTNGKKEEKETAAGSAQPMES